MKKKIRLYGRFSSVGQIGNSSVDRQENITLRAAEDYLNRNPLIKESHEIDKQMWFDEGLSGFCKNNNHSNPKSQWNQMLKQCGEGDIVVIESMSRFTRQGPLDAMILLRNYMVSKGITFYIVETNQYLDIKSFEGNNISGLLTYIGSGSNNDYVIQLAKRIKEAHKINKGLAAEGKKIYHQAKSHGWLEWEKDKNNPKEGKFIIRGDEKTTLNTLNKIFTMTLDGYGVKRVCKYLNDNIKEHPILTKMKKDKKWTISYIYRTLRDKAVLGYNKNVSMEHKQYPQVIDDNLFYAVQKHLLCPKKMGRVGGNIHLFSGLMQCECGKNYKSDCQRTNDSRWLNADEEYKLLGPNARTEAYCCNDRDNATCENTPIFDHHLLYGMKAIMSDSTFVTASLVNNISNESSSSIERQKAEVELAKAEETFTIISTAYDNNPSSNILLKKLTDAEAKVNEYKMILSVKLNTSDAVLIETYNKEVKNIYSQGYNQNSKQLHQQLLRKLINKIIIKKNLAIIHFHGIDEPIHLKFNKDCIWYKNKKIVIGMGTPVPINHRNGTQKSKTYNLNDLDHPSRIIKLRCLKNEETFTGTRFDFCRTQHAKYPTKRWNQAYCDVGYLMKGQRLSCRGWVLEDNRLPEDSSSK